MTRPGRPWVLPLLLLAGCAGEAPPVSEAVTPATGAALVPPAEVPRPEAAPYEPRPEGSVTFARHIAPILYEHCATCHRPGESGPFPLLTYEDARKRARQMVDVVRSGFMPPWLPEPGYNAFVAGRGMTDEEIGLLVQWARDGAPAGDRAGAPPLPAWTEGWQLGEPDVVLEFQEPYTLRAEPPDVFRNFVIPAPVDTTRWVRTVEFRPGNYTVVHHAEVQIDETHGSRRLDADDEEPGFAGMHGETAHAPGGHFIGWVPGRMPYGSDDEMAWRLEEGSDIVVQLHLLPSGKPETVAPRIGLHFAERPPSRQPFMIRLGRRTIDIEPNDPDYRIEDSYVLPVDVELRAVVPHAHYLGKDMKGWAELPDGSKRWLVRIKDWDFNWQDEFRYAEPVRLPRGTRLAMQFTFDNSADNVRNPHHPPRRVRFGPSTYDEMGDLWLQVVPDSGVQLGRLIEHYQRFSVEREVERWTVLAARDPADANPPNNLGHQLMQSGRTAEAAEAFRRSVALDPDYANARENLAVALFELGRPEEAIEEFRRAQALEPDDAEARANLAHVLGSLGRFHESIAELEHALRVDPDLPRAHVNLGRALELTGRFDDALEHYLEAVRLEPDWLLALHYAATLLAVHPDPEQRDGGRAVELASHAAELAGGRDPRVLETLASAYAAAGDFERAIGTATRALEGLGAAGGQQGARLRERLARYRLAIADAHPSVSP